MYNGSNDGYRRGSPFNNFNIPKTNSFGTSFSSNMDGDDMNPWGQRYTPFLTNSNNFNHNDYEEKFYGYSSNNRFNYGGFTNKPVFKRKWDTPSTCNKSSIVAGGQVTWLPKDGTLPQDLCKLFEPLNCKLCQADLTSTVMAKVHYSSNAHEKKLRRWLVEYSERTGEPLHKRATIPIKKKEDEEKDPKHYHCSVCDIPLTGKLHAESHYMGKSHQSVLSGRAPPPRKKNSTSLASKKFDCDACEINVTSERQLGAHLAGQKHKWKVDSKQFACEICEINVTSEKQLDAHLSGQKHKRKVRVLEEGLDSPQPAATPAIKISEDQLPQSFGLSCETCTIVFNSKVQLMQHMTSKKHERKLAAAKEGEATQKRGESDPPKDQEGSKTPQKPKSITDTPATVDAERNTSANVNWR